MSIEQNSIFVTSAVSGCALNVNETSIIEHFYSTENCSVVSEPRRASTIVVTTCAATNETEEFSFRTIEKLKSQNPGAELIVTGCLPRINPKKIKSLPDVKAVAIDDYVSKLVAKGESYSGFDLKKTKLLDQFPFRFQVLNLFRSMMRVSQKAHLNIFGKKLQNIIETGAANPNFRYILTSKGCKSNCAFCVIKKAKGSIKSRSLDEIQSEIQTLTSENERKFWLLADDLGCWGHDIKLNVCDLLNLFLYNDSVEEVVLGNFDPTYLIKHPEVLDILAHPKFQLINVPIQSGSNRVLNLMNRNHPIEQVVPLLKKLKQSNSNLVLKTNVIVGFPEESWSDFFKTFKLIKHFDLFYVMLYSERPGTAAEKIAGKIPRSTAFLRKVILDIFVVLHYFRISTISVLRLN